MIATGNFGDTTVPYVRRRDAADGGGQLIERLLDSLRDVGRRGSPVLRITGDYSREAAFETRCSMSRTLTGVTTVHERRQPFALNSPTYKTCRRPVASVHQ